MSDLVLSSGISLAPPPEPPRPDLDLLDLLGEAALPLPLPGRVIDGRWLLLRELGRGSLCAVFETLDLGAVDDLGPDPRRLPRAVLKTLAAGHGLHPSGLARLDHERRVLERVAGLPGVMQLLGTTEIAGAPALRLSLAPGRPLVRLLEERARNWPLPLHWSRPILLGLATALRAVHERGVAHGDLKPGNVFVTEAGSPTLLDFGAAHLLSHDGDTLAPHSEGVAVTPAWAGPVQAAGGAADEAGDVYALALMILRLVNGRHPFNGRPPREALAAGRRPQAARGVRRPLRDMLDHILNTPNSRHGVGAADLLGDLERGLG